MIHSAADPGQLFGSGASLSPGVDADSSQRQLQPFFPSPDSAVEVQIPCSTAFKILKFRKNPIFQYLQLFVLCAKREHSKCWFYA